MGNLSACILNKYFVSVQILIETAISWKHRVNEPKLAIKENSSTPVKLNSSPERDSEKSFVSSTNNRTESYNHSQRLQTSTFSTTSKFRLDDNFDDNELEENNDSFNLTPPVSRNGYYSPISRSHSRSNTPLRLNTSMRSPCTAKTRLGTPCKLTAAPGRDFCYRHQTGDSVMG